MTKLAEEGHYGNSGATRSAGDSTSESSAGVAVASAPGPEQIRDLLAGKFVCPFCGSINESEQGVCPRCTMENSPASRKATKSRIGPWYVLQTRNPAAPGMKFETLLNFARKGRVKPRSIVRGPTTHQLWKFAAQVKGLSREFGVCYSCGGPIEASASLCPQCNRLQEPPANPDVLLETKDAPAPAVPQRPSRNREPDLAEVDAEFVIPALGGAASDDSVAGVSLSGSMAGVAFDPVARAEPTNPPAPAAGNGAPVTFPPAARSNKKEDGFLSPKDLAAAFNLNFKPISEADAIDPSRPASGERRRVPRGPRPTREPRQGLQHPLDFQPHRPTIEAVDVLGAPSLDPGLDEALALSRPARKPARSDNPALPPRRRFRFLKALAFLMLFGAALYTTAIYLDHTLWLQSVQYFNQGKAAVLQAMNRSKPATEPTTPLVPEPAPGSTDRADVNDPGASAAPAPAPEPVQSDPPAVAPDHGSDAQPASALSTPAAATRPASDSAVFPPAPPPSAVAAPATPAALAPSPAVDPRPAVVALVPAPAQAPVVDPGTESLRLYREAMRVAASDPAKALARYQAIKKFPQEYWPSDLDIRIHVTEQQVKGQH
jgi:rubrerythrin